MVSNGVISLVKGLARDGESSRLLRADPERLAAKHRLGAPAVAALNDADRFFKTEKPILQRAKALPLPPRLSAAPLQVRTFVAASSDTGTLLPGPDTGTYSATNSGTGTVLAPALPAPSVPASPAAPLAPAAPIAPAMPWSPAPAIAPASPLLITPLPGMPQIAPGGRPSTGQLEQPPWAAALAAAGLPAGPANCSCTAAIVAITGLVSATTQASLTAIAAIAAQTRTRHGL